MKSLFVECNQDDVRKELADEVRKQLGGKVRLADSPNTADAVMHVSVVTAEGTPINRPLTNKDHAQARATVVDAPTGTGLWEQAAGGEKKGLGVIFGGGDAAKRIASRIVKDLKDSLNKK